MKSKPKFSNSSLEYKDGSFKKIKVKKYPRTIRLPYWKALAGNSVVWVTDDIHQDKAK